MRVINIHERELRATTQQVGALIDSLASADDRLWPIALWPRMKLDRALGVGARGGHGRIGYFVETYTPGQNIRFRFVAPEGFIGHHDLDCRSTVGGTVVLRHVIDMRTAGAARITWPLLFRPLHDALLEDALTRAEAEVGMKPKIFPWSWRVKLLRRLFAGANAPKQTAPLFLSIPISSPAPSASEI